MVESEYSLFPKLLEQLIGTLLNELKNYLITWSPNELIYFVSEFECLGLQNIRNIYRLWTAKCDNKLSVTLGLTFSMKQLKPLDVQLENKNF